MKLKINPRRQKLQSVYTILLDNLERPAVSGITEFRRVDTVTSLCVFLFLPLSTFLAAFY